MSGGISDGWSVRVFGRVLRAWDSVWVVRDYLRLYRCLIRFLTGFSLTVLSVVIFQVTMDREVAVDEVEEMRVHVISVH